MSMTIKTALQNNAGAVMLFQAKQERNQTNDIFHLSLMGLACLRNVWQSTRCPLPPAMHGQGNLTGKMTPGRTWECLPCLKYLCTGGVLRFYCTNRSQSVFIQTGNSEESRKQKCGIMCALTKHQQSVAATTAWWNPLPQINSFDMRM